jgi:hypothetical protein
MVSRAEQRRLVWSGKMRKTTGGLNRDDLMLNRSGRIVSKRKSEAASKANNLGTWLRVSGQGFKEVPPKKEKTRLQADGQCGEPNPEEGAEEGAEKNSQEKHKLQTEHVVVEGTGTRARKLQGRRAVEQEQGAGRRRGARHGSGRQETEGQKISRPRKNFPVRRRRRFVVKARASTNSISDSGNQMSGPICFCNSNPNPTESKNQEVVGAWNCREASRLAYSVVTRIASLTLICVRFTSA